MHHVAFSCTLQHSRQERSIPSCRMPKPGPPHPCRLDMGQSGRAQLACAAQPKGHPAQTFGARKGAPLGESAAGWLDARLIHFGPVSSAIQLSWPQHRAPCRAPPEANCPDSGGMCARLRGDSLASLPVPLSPSATRVEMPGVDRVAGSQRGRHGWECDGAGELPTPFPLLIDID